MRVQPFGWCFVGNDPPAIGNEPTKMGVTSELQPGRNHSSSTRRTTAGHQEISKRAEEQQKDGREAFLADPQDEIVC